MGLEQIPGALAGLGFPVYHCQAEAVAEQYLVWAENGASTVWADDSLLYQADTGTLDFFTKIDLDPAAGQIQQALLEGGISFKLESVRHGDPAGYHQYRWIWSIY